MRRMHFAPRLSWLAAAGSAWLLLIGFPANPVRAQEAQLYYTRVPEMRIPFGRDVSGRLKQVQLYVSTDQGRDWRFALSANPSEGYFPVYTAGGDGNYWFAVRAIDLQDRPNPESLSQLTPQLRIVLDRRPPVIILRQVQDPRPGVVSVEWEVREENFDARRFALEYRVSGRDWQREANADPRPQGTQSWQLDPGVRMEARLRAADRAGNESEQVLPLTLGGEGRSSENVAQPMGNSGLIPGATPGMFYSKSTRISLTYTIDKVPPSGMPVFDLWYTKDKGQRWTKTPRAGEASAGTGALPSTPGAGGTEATVGKLVFDADTQGLYGFHVVARNGVGIGDKDPRPGDPPRYWVMVDTEAPKVTMRIQRGQGYDIRHLRIEWSADDPNIADRPVTLEYAELRGSETPAESDWKPIPLEGLNGPQERSGVVTWSVPKEGPFKFHIRTKAVDKAGNIGIDQTKEPLVVDLEHPRVNITGIEPAAHAPPGQLP